MKRMQSGFTLIELVVVIVILGILSAVALPKFINLTGSADTAALAGVAGGISSASAVNYSGRLATAGLPVAQRQGVATIGLTCTSAINAFMQGGLPSGYTTKATIIVAGDNYCPITQTSSNITTTAPPVIAPAIASPDVLGVN